MPRASALPRPHCPLCSDWLRAAHDAAHAAHAAAHALHRQLPAGEVVAPSNAACLAPNDSRTGPSRRAARQRAARAHRLDRAVLRAAFGATPTAAAARETADGGTSGGGASAVDPEVGGGIAAGEAGGAGGGERAGERGESEVMTSACAALTVGEMASMQSALVSGISDGLASEEAVGGIMDLLMAPITMMLMPMMAGSSSKKSFGGVGATVIDIVVLVITIPIATAMAQALAPPLANRIANIVAEYLVLSLTSKMTNSIKLHSGTLIAENLVVIICQYIISEMGPSMAFIMAAFLCGVLPTALTDAVTTGVTNLVIPKLTGTLAAPVSNYYYCVYCYYYGDFCQVCYQNGDLTWMERDWWQHPQPST